MKLDKDLYRQAMQWYRQWNEEELRQQIKNAGTEPWQKKWGEFMDLWEFGHKLGFHPSRYQREQKLEAMEQYLKRVEQMESWRKNRAK